MEKKRKLILITPVNVLNKKLKNAIPTYLVGFREYYNTVWRICQLFLYIKTYKEKNFLKKS